MKTISLFLFLSMMLFISSCNVSTGKNGQSNPNSGVAFKSNSSDNSVDVMMNGSLFTTFRWPGNVTKPILFPILTSAGTEITRGFPIKPKVGERADHPHQIGMWFTYGNVNGNDFWGNGSQGLGTRNSNGGVIKHQKVKKMSGGDEEGILVSTESWQDSLGHELMTEHTEYHFIIDGSTRIIDRLTTLTAGKKSVEMEDTKEGMFGIRVARELELPSQGSVTLYSADGKPEKVKQMSNKDISGMYRSSEGNVGLGVWGDRAKWMNLYGNIGGEDISVVICDHPRNVNYPTWWHARGYGLFSANPLGAEDFTDGKVKVNFTLPAKQSVTFRYRTLISSGAHLTHQEINRYADSFSKKY